MEVDSETRSSYPTDSSLASATAFIVLDTNFLLDNLTLVESIQAWHSKYKHALALAWTVVQELNGLKRRTQISDGARRLTVGALAREAIRWAQDALRSDHSGVIGQRRNETTDETATGDDAILAYCLFLKKTFPVPVTLLTNDHNLAIKAQANDILALSNTSPSGEPLSSDLLIRQALHGPLPLENTFIRPHDGEDIRMMDLSGTMADRIQFLPGLGASKYAPKTPCTNNQSTRIAIDPETGAVMLLKPGERQPSKGISQKYSDLTESLLLSSGIDKASTDFGHDTYADIMAMDANRHLSGDEMEWESYT